jgi:hypothetical protein
MHAAILRCWRSLGCRRQRERRRGSAGRRCERAVNNRIARDLLSDSVGGGARPSVG